MKTGRQWVGKQASKHMCVRNHPQKSFLSYTLFTGVSRARLSRGPLYLYVLWLEIMHNGVLAARNIRRMKEKSWKQTKRNCTRIHQLYWSFQFSTLSCNLDIPDNRKAKKKPVRIDRLQSFALWFSPSCPFFTGWWWKEEGKMWKRLWKINKTREFCIQKKKRWRVFSVFTFPICKSPLQENCDLVILIMMIFLR